MLLRLCIAAAAVFALTRGVPAEHTNLVILYTDDQGTLDANCYGSTDLITPNIDKLAATGIRFTQAYAHTVCCPSRAALMTGRHPQRGGVYHWTQGDMNSAEGINMSLEEVTLAEALNDAGYRTALYGKWHLGAHRDFGPKKQGFDEFFGIRDGFIDNYNHYFLHQTGFHDLYEGTEEVFADGKYFPEMMVQRSLTFLEENKDRPFFLYVPFNIPHYPEQALAEFEKLYTNIDDPGTTIVCCDDQHDGSLCRPDRRQTRNARSTRKHDRHFHERQRALRRNQKHDPCGRSQERLSERTLSTVPAAEATPASGSETSRPSSKAEFAYLPSSVIRRSCRRAKFAIKSSRPWIGSPRSWNYAASSSLMMLPRWTDTAWCRSFIHPDADSQYNGVLHFAWGNSWAVRDGDWKLIGTSPKNGNRMTLSLHHLADEHPEARITRNNTQRSCTRLTELHQRWVRDVTPN